MKDRKIFITCIGAAALALQAAYSYGLNITQVDKMVPVLPDAKDYACMAYSVQDNSIFSQCFTGRSGNSEDKMRDYDDKVSAAKDRLKTEKDAYQDKNQEIATKAEGSMRKAEAGKKLKHISGMDISVEDLQNMTEEQKKAFGHKAAAYQMSKTGAMGNMSQADIMKLATMSDKEREAYMMQKMSGSENTGLTPAEIQKLSKMNDEEIETYLKKNPDVMKRMQNSGMARKAAAARNAKSKQAAGEPDPLKKNNDMLQAQKQLRKTIEPENMKAAKKQIKQLFNEKYKNSIKQARENYSRCYIRYSPDGYIFADGKMADSEVRAMKNADRNCGNMATWDASYREFTLAAGDIWAKALKKDLNAIKASSANGNLKKMKTSAYFSNFDSPEMQNYVNNLPGIDGTDEYINMLEEAGKTFDMPEEAGYCDYAWLARAKSISDKDEKNDLYQAHSNELSGCTKEQLKSVGLTASALSATKQGKNGKNKATKEKPEKAKAGNGLGIKGKLKGAAINKMGL